ncbi:energy-coupled thiamine transporter ThiT [Virgibacillus sp. 179-BFC.A HS]|uniref:Energy-coupled thiamine transporter ThiT n=1 Tax=Tigheibacillus jepli TaxID=3035914 RepID=A0ABU5CIA2_9BACI|nr:energy-coupled thiamine transporter ThiT [Virgibacillus sp. 179-BFC.A HS]MDY0406059.1 energy-coupled thiamine transporter ThiT [Virgibacillus sp. 179-BFC.A HS]
MNHKKTLFLIEVAIFAGLALALDMIPFLQFKIWAQGGSISLAMIPIFIVSFRWGLKGGLLSGFLWGILQIPLGGYVLVPLQGFIDYAVAFTVLGFAGVFAGKIKQAVKEGHSKAYFTYILMGVVLGSMLRFAAHFTAGIVFFSESLPDGWHNAWIYSLVYNASYMVPSMIICTAGIYFLFNKQPRSLLNAAA